jgi:homoserine dehydrogenase
VKNQIGIGILGCGNVGSALVLLLQKKGIDFNIEKIAVKHINTQRADYIDTSKLTDDANSVIEDDKVDIVVELIGGISPAKALIEKALKKKKPVVTGNKELIAKHGIELTELANKNGVDLLYEASVCGAIPIVRLLKESLAGEDISRIIGILNGTTNYILTKMTEERLSFEDSLKMAQNLGYAEKDPTADIKGLDAGAKAAILGTIAFATNVDLNSVFIEGIYSLTTDDIDFATKNSLVIKLVGVIEKITDQKDNFGGQVSIRVHPIMISKSHPLASVRNAYNAVFIEGESIGEIMLYGKGAGGFPTASAVLGDILDASHNISLKTFNRFIKPKEVAMFNMDELSSEFYISVDVADEPGVLAKVAHIFGKNQVSIASMEQIGFGSNAKLVFFTHKAKELNMTTTVEELSALDSVRKVGSVIRVMTELS